MMRAGLAIGEAVASGSVRQASFEKSTSQVRAFFNAGGRTHFSNIRWESLLEAKLVKEFGVRGRQ